MASGFLIGEQFLGRIRSAVDAHEGYIRKEEPHKIATRLEGDLGASGFRGIYTIKVRLNKAAIDQELAQWPAHLGLPADEKKLQIKLQEGHAIGLEPFEGLGAAFLGTSPLMPRPENAAQDGSVSNIGDLANLEVKTSSRRIESSSLLAGSERFGVIRSIAYDTDKESEEDNAYYQATVIVGGLFVCRALAYAPGDRLMAPPPVPGGNMAQRWHPYPLMAPAGPGIVLATGGYFRTGPNEWPRVYEVLVRL